MILLEEFWKMVTNPGEYSQVLVLVGMFAGICAFVTGVAFVGWRGTYTWGRRRRRLNFLFILGAAALSLLGLFFLSAEFYFESEDMKRSVDLKWIFVLPAVLSVIALRRFFDGGGESGDEIRANAV